MAIRGLLSMYSYCGRIQQGKVVECRTANASTDAAEKRCETVRKAVTQSEIINQLDFATASGNKWGDYDVDVEKLME